MSDGYKIPFLILMKGREKMKTAMAEEKEKNILQFIKLMCSARG